MREGEDLLPLQDMEFITSVLDVFGLAPFKDTETGTSIIIPYLKSPELLGGILPADAEIEAGVQEHFKSVWTASVPDYLKLAIERWYAPKIHNRELPKFCDKKWLMVSVNHIPIRKQDMSVAMTCRQSHSCLSNAGHSRICGRLVRWTDH